MEALKKRQNAIVLFVVVVVVFTLLGCHRSLSKVCRQAETAFMEKGAFSDQGYYTSPGDQLKSCVKYANRLLSLLSGSQELTESYNAIRDSRLALDSALEAQDISDIYDANQALVEAVTQADALVQAGAPLSASGDDYDTIVSDFFAAENVAAQSPYNDYVDDFIRTTIRPFPTNILRVAAFVKLPEKYE
jgi:hypothetical protein